MSVKNNCKHCEVTKRTAAYTTYLEFEQVWKSFPETFSYHCKLVSPDMIKKLQHTRFAICDVSKQRSCIKFEIIERLERKGGE